MNKTSQNMYPADFYQQIMWFVNNYTVWYVSQTHICYLGKSNTTGSFDIDYIHLLIWKMFKTIADSSVLTSIIILVNIPKSTQW